jgi:hypothetical protein
MIMYLLFLVILLLQPPVQAYLNRERGDDQDKRPLEVKKTIVYALMTLSTSLCFVTTAPLDYYTLGFVGLLFGFDILRDAPSRGEIFPQLRDTSREKYAILIRPLTNLIAGYKYITPMQNAAILRWKTIAISLYFAIFSLPRAILLTVFCYYITQSSASFLLLTQPILNLFCGYIYRKCFDSGKGDPVEVAEVKVGFYRGALDSILLCYILS